MIICSCLLDAVSYETMNYNFLSLYFVVRVPGDRLSRLSPECKCIVMHVSQRQCSYIETPASVGFGQSLCALTTASFCTIRKRYMRTQKHTPACVNVPQFKQLQLPVSFLCVTSLAFRSFKGRFVRFTE